MLGCPVVGDRMFCQWLEIVLYNSIFGDQVLLIGLQLITLPFAKYAVWSHNSITSLNEVVSDFCSCGQLAFARLHYY